MAGIIPKRTLDDIRFRCDIADVIGAYVNVQRAGSTMKALCPFHKEKTPSFNINTRMQIFHCFGCGVGGDVFKFIMLQEGVDFITAAKMLAQRAGVPLELDEGGEGGGPDKHQLYEIHTEVARLYHEALRDRTSALVAREYLEKRHLEGDIIEEFFIGYAPNLWDAVLTWAEKQKYSQQLMESAGLIIHKSPGAAASTPEWYDRFRNRLMFPIRDEQGRVIGFSGRTLDERDKTAKYVNSPDSPLFHKSRVLYALDKARRHIVESREAIICEGQIDVIRCHQAGFRTAVASQGTAFTEDHVRILRRYADGVVLVFDSDKAGQDATVRSAITFMDAGLAVRVARLPPGEDPDSFIRDKGADAFKDLLDRATSAVAFQVEVLAGRENLKSEVGIMRASKALLETIRHNPNAVQRAKLVQEAAERLGIPASAIQDELRRTMMEADRQADRRATYRNEEAAAEVPASPAQAPAPVEEVMLCEHLVHAQDDPGIVEVVRGCLLPEMVTDPQCRRFMEAALAAFDTGANVQDVLREKTEDIEMTSFAARMLMTPSKVVAREFSRLDATKGIVLRIWRKRLEAERRAIEMKGAEATRADAERRMQITHDLKALGKWEDGSAIIKIEMEIGGR